MPQETNGYVDPILSGISQDYANTALQAMASEAIFPSVRVERRDSKYGVFSKSNLALPPVSTDIAGNGGRVPRVDFARELEAVNATDRGLEISVDSADAQQLDAPFAQAEADAAKSLIDRLLLDNEIRAVEALKASKQTKLKGDGSDANNKWSGKGGDPLKKIAAIRKQMLVLPNTLVLGKDVWHTLESNSKIKAELAKVTNISGGANTVTEETLKQLFKVDKVMIAQPFSFGSTGQPQYIWDGLLWLGYTAGRPQARNLTFGARFWVGWSQAANGGFVVTKYRDESGGVLGATVIKVAGSFDHKIMSADCGHLLTDVV